jgi:hypothetical protein
MTAVAVFRKPNAIPPCSQFAYCAAVMAEYFDVVEVCCETVVACVEPEVCDCLLSGVIFVFFHVVFMFCHCVLLDEAMASWENFSRVFFNHYYRSCS